MRANPSCYDKIDGRNTFVYHATLTELKLKICLKYEKLLHETLLFVRILIKDPDEPINIHEDIQQKKRPNGP